jgi:hypothetical protein
MAFNPDKLLLISEAEEERKINLIKKLKVKEVSALSYDRWGKAKFAGRPVLVEKYDTDGALIESFRHTEEFIDEKITMSTEADGKIIKTIIYDDLDHYKYNQAGKLIEIAVYSPAKRLKSRSRFKYEQIAGTREQCTEFDRCGRLAGKSITTFNDKRLVDSVVYYNDRGFPYTKVKHQYNSFGKITSSQEISSLEHEAGMPKVVGRKAFCVLYVDEYSYHYDGSGNLVERIKHSIDGTVDWDNSESYKYDREGRLAQKINYNKDGATLMLVNYTYDSNGWLISKKLTNRLRKVLFAEKSCYSDSGLELERIMEDFEEYKYSCEKFSYIFYEGSPLT